MFARRPGRHRPDQVVAMHRNAWSPSPECAHIANNRPFDKKFVSRLCKRIFRGVGAPDLRLHDLRHQAATGMAQCRVPLDIRQLVQNQITGRRQSIGARYDQHEYFDEKLRSLTLWEGRLLAIVSGQKPPAEKY